MDNKIVSGVEEILNFHSRLNFLRKDFPQRLRTKFYVVFCSIFYPAYSLYDFNS